MPVETLVRKNARLSDRAVLDLKANLQQYEQDVLDRLLEFMRRFPTDGTHFVPTDNVAELVNAVKREMQGVVDMRALTDSTKAFVSNFDEIQANVRAIHGEENGLKVPKSLVNPEKLFAIDATEYALRNANINPAFILPVRKALYSHIKGGASVQDAERVIRGLVLGAGGQNGALTQWVGQVATDAINQYEGNVQRAIAVEYGLTGVHYVNSIIETSRAQCVRWCEMEYLPQSIIAEEIAWAKRNGSGMVAETTPDTFLVYRGGYRCRHKGIPVKDEIARKGYKGKGGVPVTPPKPVPTPPIEPPVAPPPPPAPVAPPAPPKPARAARKPKAPPQANTINELVERFNALVPAENVISSRKAVHVNAMKAILMEQANVVEIIAKRGTFLTLRAPSEKSAGGVRKLLKAIGSTKSAWDVGIVPSTAKGSATLSNSALNVVINKDEKIEFVPIEMEITDEQIKERGWREVLDPRFGSALSNGKHLIAFEGPEEGTWVPFSVSGQSVKNAAPTLTHEAAHVIHNTVDVKAGGYGERELLKASALKAGITLKNAPTFYGRTNWSEFWAETWTAYTYANAWLKKEHPKTFKFFEDMLKKYGIDKATIKIAE